MNLTNVLQAISQFEKSVTITDFEKIFDKSDHLWDKFTYDYDYSVIKFWNSLDDKNKEIFANYLNEYINI
jgi:hypothetical protein